MLGTAGENKDKVVRDILLWTPTNGPTSVF